VHTGRWGDSDRGRGRGDFFLVDTAHGMMCKRGIGKLPDHYPAIRCSPTTGSNHHPFSFEFFF
jgi:hypothetical protein